MMRPINNDIKAVANRSKPTAFFSGCGGTAQGLRDAGFNVVGGIECDKLAVETYRDNHRRVEIWKEDIRRIKRAEVLKKLGLERG